MFDLPEGTAMQEFAKYAGANNAFTSYTMTAYYVECTEHLEENFEILLRMVTTGYFTEESVQKERGIIAQEIKMYEDSADSAVMENLFRIMYQNHPVRNNIAGTVESIEDITAIIALYRPGPMDSIPKFIACKHDPGKVSYIIPQLESILSITYGLSSIPI